MKHLYELAQADLHSVSTQEMYDAATNASQAERDVVQEDLIERLKRIQTRNYELLERLTNGNHTP